MNVGFIGLGIMGESMSENIIKGGYDTYVYDIDPKKIEKLADLGAKPCKSIGEVAEKTDYIIIMVPNNSHVEDVIGKLLPKITNGKIIIDMSTISPSVSRKLAQEVKEKGGIMIDAPVVKSKSAAISGDLGILVGGDEKVFKSVKLLLSCMGRNIIRMGDNGAGLIMKLCHNMLVAEIQNGVNEMLILAKNSGLDFNSVIKAISYGGGQNFYLDSKAESIKNRDFSPKFPFEHMNKDINLAVDFTSELGLKLETAEQIKKIYGLGMDEKLNREDFSATLKIAEKLAKK